MTDKVLALTPLLTELALWSDKHLGGIHTEIQNGEGLEMMRNDKAAFANMLEENYREKLALKLSNTD